ncbi:MAG: glycosyltransferase family 2 protein [Dysgonamonadaceae bacterium]|jgi:GT2 family glycosyltransferase|nr:glycosyltransferase family 2 protein [Dysgonamonadaceae bacterium]
MKRTGVVVLNWNGKALLKQFLPSLIRYTDSEQAEIIVADNGSTDGSPAFLAEHYPDIRCLAFDKNYGFAEGYNRALASLEHEYAVLLNSDIEVSAGWLRLAVDYLDTHPDVAALQPKILAYNDRSSFEYAGAAGGFMDMYGYPFCRGRIFADMEKDYGQYDSPVDVLWGSGACLIIRSEEYKKAGGLDACFFAHQEEIDLCWRLRARGKRIVCFPQSVVYHVGGATLKMEHPRKTFLNFRNNLLLLYKNLPDRYYKKVMFCRYFLDYLAALRFFLNAYPANALAVIQARRDFNRNKANYKPVRQENLAQTVNNDLPPEIMRENLLWHYHIRNKKTFSALYRKGMWNK